MNDMQITREKNPMYFKLWDLKCVRKWEPGKEHLKGWYDYNIYATTTKDLIMNVWNGRHPVEDNCASHICRAGTRVLIWMVSRFGDVGVTDNLDNPKGYDVRGVDADNDLINFEFIELK